MAEKEQVEENVEAPLRTRQEAKTDAEWDKALSESRSAAVSTLRNENQERFTRLLVENMAARGFLYEPRPSARDRAKERLRTLAAEAGVKITIED